MGSDSIDIDVPSNRVIYFPTISIESDPIDFH
jgi:hypothetical protein